MKKRTVKMEAFWESLIEEVMDKRLFARDPHWVKEMIMPESCVRAALREAIRRTIKEISVTIEGIGPKLED